MAPALYVLMRTCHENILAIARLRATCRERFWLEQSWCIHRHNSTQVSMNSLWTNMPQVNLHFNCHGNIVYMPINRFGEFVYPGIVRTEI